MQETRRQREAEEERRRFSEPAVASALSDSQSQNPSDMHATPEASRHVDGRRNGVRLERHTISNLGDSFGGRGSAAGSWQSADRKPPASPEIEPQSNSEDLSDLPQGLQFVADDVMKQDLGGAAAESSAPDGQQTKSKHGGI